MFFVRYKNELIVLVCVQRYSLWHLATRSVDGTCEYELRAYRELCTRVVYVVALELVRCYGIHEPFLTFCRANPDNYFADFSSICQKVHSQAFQ